MDLLRISQWQPIKTQRYTQPLHFLRHATMLQCLSGKESMKTFVSTLIITAICFTSCFGQESSGQPEPVVFPPRDFEVSSIQVVFRAPDREGVELSGQIKVPAAVQAGDTLVPIGKLTIQGKWKNVPAGKKNVPCELPLVFEARQLADLQTISERAKEEGWPIEWKIDDRMNVEKSGNPRDPDNEDSDAEKNSPNSTELEFKQTVRFDIPAKAGNVKVTVPFSFHWDKNNDWKVGYYYSVHATHPKLDVATTRAGMFQVTKPPKVPVSVKAKKITYYFLKIIGSDPDPRYWLFENSNRQNK